MPGDKSPGVSREQRISDEGLQRLEKHLRPGTAITAPVLKQWLRRYGEPARDLLKKYDRYTIDLED